MQNIISIVNQHPAYFFMASLGTVLYLLKLSFLFFGASGDDSSLSFDEISPTSHWSPSDAFKHLSLQAIFAFFMGTGWMGLACREVWQLSATGSLLVAMTFGFCMLLMTILLTYKVHSLNTNGVYSLKSCIGSMGQAYTDIPLLGQSAGQVMITASGRQQIFPAISVTTSIAAFSPVKVQSIDGNTLMVVPIHPTKE